MYASQVHAAGGGIGFTVRKTAEASDQDLLSSLKVSLLPICNDDFLKLEYKVYPTYPSKKPFLSKFLLLQGRYKRMSRSGTTCVEVKSGYGLELEPELKLLRILTTAQEECKHFIETSITYCGAHSVPKVRLLHVST